MKVYSIRLKVESPLICTEEQVGNVLKHSGHYLKGRTLRGAFLGPAYRDHPDEVIEESKNPKLIFHPAYPIFGDTVSEPAHPFVYSCKICGKIEEKDPYEVLEKLEKNTIPEAVCPNFHVFSMKTLGRSLLIRKNGVLEKRDLEFTSVKSVGINRFLKGAERKMLYEYITLSPGLEFKGFIVDLDDKAERLGLLEREEIRIGRGCTRGFGKVSLEISLEKNALDMEERRIRKILQKRNGILVLRALSIVCRLKMDTKGLYTEPFPEIVEKWLKPIEFPKLNGNCAIVGFEESLGFSNVSKLPIPRLVGAGIGSLFFYNVDKDHWNEVSKKLAERRFIGFGPFSCIGMNILEVYDVDKPDTLGKGF